ncbi:hypothetical protein RKE29_21170 [Streptomyces sp. B1866]|uniref:hypothetical protein n=1 Tax=Streptomyces sp. B1866 TaxID=3075431 RepID=UPI002892931E|nr:hypothetical protein [Streptomyces sp. B1866]MDT3399125.1 hypothetical protein [Streptomyces sp. B1866]
MDREGERARVLGAVARWDEGSRPLCAALSGLGGCGKTELAFDLARALEDDYPDGVLYVDLDTLRRDGAVDMADAVGALLRFLDVTPEWLERSYADLCRQYWDRTRGARLVVIVDNARYGAEVVPLLPASGGSLLIVTSHGPLYDMDGRVDVEVPVDPLPERYARELLRRVAAPDDPRLAAEPEAADGLLRLCSGLPPALYVAARWMRRHSRRPLSRLLAELTAEMRERGLPEVERVWDAAYRELSPDAALLYRLLADAPGGSCSAEAAAALLGRGRDAADGALEELTAAGLLDARDERVRLSELLRAHARRRARTDADGREADAALRRIVRWYLRQAQRADAVAAGRRMVLAAPEPAQPGAPDVPFEDVPFEDVLGEDEDARRARRAARWLDAERHALYACVRLAYGHGLDAEAWALCEPLWTHYLDHPDYPDVTEAFRTAVAAAQRAGDVRALIRMRCQLARPLWEQQLFAEAAGETEQALAATSALGDAAGDRKLGASVREFHGMLHSARGDWAAAAAAFAGAREVHREIGNAYGVMLQTYRLGEAMAALGDLREAAGLLEQAHAAAVEQRRARMSARTGFALGGVLLRLGRPGEARVLYEAALAGARDRGSEYDEARVLDALAALADQTGNEPEAAGHRAAARAIRVRNGGLVRS